MHLVTLNAAGHASPGVIAGDSILDLGAAVAILSVAKLIPSGMRGLLEGGDAALDLLMERIGAIIKGPMQVVGYKGGGPAVADMIGGQIPLVIQPVVTFLGQARAGKARILTVLLPRRRGADSRGQRASGIRRGAGQIQGPVRATAEGCESETVVG